jgi:iron complex outermembrane recepter protein
MRLFFFFLSICSVVIVNSQTTNTKDTISKVNQLQEVSVKTIKTDNGLVVREELTAKTVAQTRGQSLGEVLSRANGVTVLQTGSTIFKPVIHGLHSQRVLILNNGVRQEGQQWGSEHAPEIDPFIADKFTILKGAGALRYGSDAIAGAVLVEPRQLPTTVGTKGEINAGYFSNNRQYVLNGMVEQNSAKKPQFSWRLQATYKRGGNARTPDYWLWNTGLREFNYSAAAAWRGKKFNTELFFSSFNTDLGIFIGSHIGNLTDLQNAIQSPKPTQNIDAFSYDIGRPRQEVSHYLLKSRTVFDLKEADKLILTLSRQENIRREYDRALITDRPELDLNIGTTSLDISREYAGKRSGQINYGITGQLQENVWDGSRFFIPNFIATNISLYGIKKWSKNNWLYEAGLRYDYRFLRTYRNQNGVISSLDRNFNNLSASGGIAYKFNQQLKILVNGALAWRAPQVNELYVNGLHHGTASFEIGDSSLQAERAYNFSVQLQYKTDSTWNVDLQLYNNYIDGFINLIPSIPPTLTLRGAYPTFRYVQTNARLSGFNFSVERYFSAHWSAGAKTAFLWAWDRTRNDWLIQMPPNRAEAELNYYFSGWRKDQRYIQLRYLHVLEQKNVPVSIPDYIPPPAAYHLLQIDFATTFQISKKDINFGVTVSNLLNTQYRDYMNRFRYFNDEIGRSINLRLKLQL